MSLTLSPTLSATLSQARRNRSRRLRARRRRKAGVLPPGLHEQLQRLHRYLSALVVPSLPPLGEFATDALGHELARRLQMALFSRGWRLVSIALITLSSGFLTVDIEETVRASPTIYIYTYYIYIYICIYYIEEETDRARCPHPNPDPHPAPDPNPNPSRRPLRLPRTRTLTLALALTLALTPPLTLPPCRRCAPRG